MSSSRTRRSPSVTSADAGWPVGRDESKVSQAATMHLMTVQADRATDAPKPATARVNWKISPTRSSDTSVGGSAHGRAAVTEGVANRRDIGPAQLLSEITPRILRAVAPP